MTMPEEPEEPKKPSRDDYKDDKAYEKAMKQYEEDWDAYDKAMGQWEQDMSDYYDQAEAAEEADSARYELENTSAKDFIADLYYYDGNTTGLVAENVAVNNWLGAYSLMSSVLEQLYRQTHGVCHPVGPVYHGEDSAVRSDRRT